MELTAATASAVQQGNIESQIAMKVAVKAQDVVKQQGEAAVSLLESAVENGEQINSEQSRIEGRGGQVDVRG